MTGISVRYDPEPRHIHIHSKDEDLSFYENTPHYATWVHASFAPGEHICTIWEIPEGDTKGLGIGASKGRFIPFGSTEHYFHRL